MSLAEKTFSSWFFFSEEILAAKCKDPALTSSKSNVAQSPSPTATSPSSSVATTQSSSAAAAAGDAEATTTETATSSSSTAATEDGEPQAKKLKSDDS